MKKEEKKGEKIGKKIGIAGCSNGQPLSGKSTIEKLAKTLTDMGFIPVFSRCLYARDTVFSGTGKERAQALMELYEDPSVRHIFDISGGDLANEVLPYLDYDLIGKSRKCFWGYSDLTTVINAVYARTGKPSVLYQIRNLVLTDGEKQREDFAETMLEGRNTLYDFAYEWIQGKFMRGIVAGGNIRCLLKLAGTPYWPEMTGKILFLEARGGGLPQMATYLNQLAQMGVFEKINGILLGTFTAMEADHCFPAMPELVRSYVGEKMPIARTGQIGHGTDSKALVIGRELTLS